MLAAKRLLTAVGVVVPVALLLLALTALWRGLSDPPSVPLLRIEGGTRVETAVAASRQWSSPGTVVLVGVDAADTVVLDAAACAADLDAPLLLVPARGPTPLLAARLRELPAVRVVAVGTPAGLATLPELAERTSPEDALCPDEPAPTTRLLAIPPRLEEAMRSLAARPAQERTLTRLVIAAGSDRPGVPDLAVALALARHLERGGELTPVGVAVVDREVGGDLRRELRRHGTTVTGAVVVGGDAAVEQRVREEVARSMVARDWYSLLGAGVTTVEQLGELTLALLGLLTAATVATAAAAAVSPGLRQLLRVPDSSDEAGPTGAAAATGPPPTPVVTPAPTGPAGTQGTVVGASGPPTTGTREVHLLVVHGIGDHEPGSTVQRWAEALDAWCRRRKGWTSEITRCDLTSVPATATLRTSPPGGGTLVVRMTEGHWGDAFPEPTPRRVLRWLLTSAPAVVVLQAVLILRSGGAWRHKAYRAGTALLPLIVATVLLAVLAPVVVLVVLVLLVLSALPVDAVRTSVGKLLGVLATTVGDSFLFVADPVSRAAMVSRVRARLEALTTSDDPPWWPSAPLPPVVVLAHSQGAAVAHRAITTSPGSGPGTPFTGFVTVGSGLGRLHDVQGLDPVPRSITAVNVAAALALAAAWSERTPPGLGWAAVAAWALVLGLWARQLPEVTDPVPVAVVSPAWVDVWAPFDLVPNGEPWDLGAPGYSHHLVPGDLSVVRDHLRYSSDAAEVLPRIVRALRDAAGLPEPEITCYRSTSGENPFAFRHWWAFVLRLVPVLAAVWVLWDVDASAWGHWLLTVSPAAAGSAVDAGLSPVRQLLELSGHQGPGTDSVVGSAIVLGHGLLASAVVLRLWTSLRNADVDRWLRTDLRRGRAWWSAVCAGLLLVTAVLVLPVLPLREGPRWSPGAVTDAYLDAVAEGRADRLCHALDDPAGCRDRAQVALADVCEDAREAYAAVEVEVTGSGGRRRVPVDFRPEQRPSCPATGSTPVEELEVARTGHRWSVVCPGGAEGRPIGC